MSSNKTLFPATMAILLVLAGCQGESEQQSGDQAMEQAATETASTDSEAMLNSAADSTAVMPDDTAEPAPVEHSLVALPGKEDQVPEITEKTTIVLHTTAGDVTLEVYPEAAPNAAERFVTLVESGFYDNIPVSRVIPGFMAQFGINWREEHRDWQNNNFDDDPSLFALDPGTIAFAKAGPDTNSTQVFINYTNNNYLSAPQQNFTTFGKVIEGMEVVEQFQQVGDPSGGLNQGRLWNDGEAYLAELPVTPTYIESAEVID